MHDCGHALSRDSRSFATGRLFKDIPAGIEQRLLARSTPIELAKGKRLFEKGDASGAMYLVKSGRIEISLIAESGKRVVFNQIGPKQCFGEVSLVDEKPRTASAVALEPSRLLPITRKDFFESVQQCPQLAINLLEVMCERIRWVSEAVEEYALHPLEFRLARRLLVLHRNFAEPDGQIDISQSDLADFAGATREATNKILMSWKDAGLIAIGRRKIQLLKPLGLEQLSQDDSDAGR